MATRNLGRLEKVSLREAWSNEASDFTPWLAEEENLKLLGEAIGLDLELEAQEKQVGPFRADILCKDPATDGWVLIENQLEKTNHTHLGQILTYAAGLEAVTIIWIAPEFTEEHRATLDWLNEHTTEKINFFGLEVELWRIGDSPYAPKFNVVSKPNEWSREVQQAASETSEVGELRQRFWTGLSRYLDEQKIKGPRFNSKPTYWVRLPSGIQHVGFEMKFVPRRECVDLEVWFWRAASLPVWADLNADPAAAQRLFGAPASFDERPEVSRARIYITSPTTDLQDDATWPGLYRWIGERLSTLFADGVPLLRKRIEALRTQAPS